MNLNKYINLSYKHLGRNVYDGFDCLGLVRHILLEEAKIDIGDYTELKYSKDWFKTENHILDNIKNNWIEVNKPYKLFDVLLFAVISNKYVSPIDHIGLYIGDNKFIHIQEDYVSQIDKLEFFWKKALYKAIRYKKDLILNG